MKLSRTSLLVLVIVLALLLTIWTPISPMHFWMRAAWSALKGHRAALAANKPIRFYGRIVDQHGNGVAGAAVSARILVQDGIFQSHGKRVQTTTNGAGDFQIEGYHGSNLTLEHIEKSGYWPPRRIDPGGPWRSEETADPLKPMIMIMWKCGPTEPLIPLLRSFRLTPDGRTYTIDLRKELPNEGRLPDGDLWVSITRPAKVNSIDPFDWSYKIEAIDGGLLCTNDPFLFRAPETGYQPCFEFVSKTSDNPRPDPRKSLYVRSRNGALYAGIRIGVHPNADGKSAIHFDGLINPAGSRNLEPELGKIGR